MIVAWMLGYAEQTDDDIQGAYQSGRQREFADFVKKKQLPLSGRGPAAAAAAAGEGRAVGGQGHGAGETEGEREREREVLLTVKK